MSTAQIVNLVLDGIFLILILFIIIRNSVRGFLSSLISLVKTVVAPVLAVVFNLPLARLLAKIYNGACAKWIHKLLLSTETTEIIDGVEKVLYDVDKIFEGIPDMVVRFILRAGEEWENKELIDTFFIGDGVVGPKLATVEELGGISTVLGDRVALGISIILAFVLIFVVIEILLLILGKVLNNLIKKVTVIKVINIIFGGLIGAAIAFLLSWAICFGIGQAFEFGQHYYPNVFLDDYWNGTLIVKFFIEHDLLEIIKSIAIR